ncbi:MAG: glycosyltransferase [Pseudomonadota bacterium]
MTAPLDSPPTDAARESAAQASSAKMAPAASPAVKSDASERPIRGHLEGLRDGALEGWVTHAVADRRQKPLEVTLYFGAKPILRARADRPRPDVAEAGEGPEACGFSLPLSPALRAMAAREGGWARLLVGDVEVGALKLADETGGATNRSEGFCGDFSGGFSADDPAILALRAALIEEAAAFLTAFEAVETARAAPRTAHAPSPAPCTRHRALFAPLPPRLKDAPDPARSPSLPGYLDFTRHRLRKARDFAPDSLPADRDHLLNWYLSVYGPERRGYRIPLAAQDIAYLSEPIAMGGQSLNLSRALWWRCLARRDLPDLNDRDAWLDTLHWWAWEEAPRLGCEDCLVTRAQIDALRALPVAHRHDAFPLSHAMARALKRDKAFAALSPRQPRDRLILTLALLARAATRPDLLRYLPAASVSACLEPHRGVSPLAAFLAALTGTAPPTGLDGAALTAICAAQGYDRAAGRFLTRLPEGHRLHAPALTRPGLGEGTEGVDIQLIGPLMKASGLGQATRLARDMLGHVAQNKGWRVHAVDFDLDNPAPEGFASPSAARGGHVSFGPPRRARVNLLHLNAESVPLAFAYGPDVFSGAHNIAHVYWELDRPAPCHALGLALLDEVWTSSDYGRAIYAPAFAGPVTAVGMAVEAPPASPFESRQDARASLRAAFGWPSETTIFLSTFDSYSFVQRKNPAGSVAAFERAFPAADYPDLRLILKTQNRDYVTDPAQARIWAGLEAAMARDARITLLNETLDYGALMALKAGVDCYVSLHRSEGWGFGMIEAMQLGIPVIATGYSGNMEFCSHETAWLVDYTLTTLRDDDYIFTPEGARWASPDIAHGAAQMRALLADPGLAARRAAAAKERLARAFSPEAIAARMAARLTEILAQPLEGDSHG